MWHEAGGGQGADLPEYRRGRAQGPAHSVNFAVVSEPTRQRTLWQRGIDAPIRAVLRTESASAGVLVAAIVSALLWSNLDTGSYEAFWRATRSVRLGGMEVSE